MIVMRFWYLIKTSIDVWDFLLSFTFDWEDNYIKPSRQCLITFPNTWNFIKNTPLCVAFSTSFSGFGNVIKPCLLIYYFKNSWTFKLFYLLARVQPHSSPIQHIHQTARCGHQQMTATIQLLQLATNFSSTIHHTRSHAWPVCKLQKANKWKVSYHYLPMRLASLESWNCVLCRVATFLENLVNQVRRGGLMVSAMDSRSSGPG